jgi:pimeloyl-ACP methyl ester carboxylesterase
VERPALPRRPRQHLVIDGGAHFTWIERPAAVAQAFRRFAATLPDDV